MLCLHKTSFIYLLLEQQILWLWNWKSLLFWWLFFLTWGILQNRGIKKRHCPALLLITASDGLLITKSLNYLKWMQFQNPHLLQALATVKRGSATPGWSELIENTDLELETCWDFSVIMLISASNVINAVSEKYILSFWAKGSWGSAKPLRKSHTDCRIWLTPHSGKRI